MDGEVAAYDKAVSLSEWWSYHHCSGESRTFLVFGFVPALAALVMFYIIITYLFDRWRMNMAVTLPVTTTTCVTCPSCSALTWVMRWCCSLQMGLGWATSSVAQYKTSMPLWILGRVGISQR